MSSSFVYYYMTVIWNWCSCLWPQKCVWFFVVVGFVFHVHENSGYVFFLAIFACFTFDSFTNWMLDTTLIPKQHAHSLMLCIAHHGLCKRIYFLPANSTNSLHEFQKGKTRHLADSTNVQCAKTTEKHRISSHFYVMNVSLIFIS